MKSERWRACGKWTRLSRTRERALLCVVWRQFAAQIAGGGIGQECGAAQCFAPTRPCPAFAATPELNPSACLPATPISRAPQAARVCYLKVRFLSCLLGVREAGLKTLIKKIRCRTRQARTGRKGRNSAPRAKQQPSPVPVVGSSIRNDACKANAQARQPAKGNHNKTSKQYRQDRPGEPPRDPVGLLPVRLVPAHRGGMRFVSHEGLVPIAFSQLRDFVLFDSLPAFGRLRFVVLRIVVEKARP